MQCYSCGKDIGDYPQYVLQSLYHEQKFFCSTECLKDEAVAMYGEEQL